MSASFTGSAEPLTQSGLSQVQALLGVVPAAVWAVVSVETSGCGFLPDRRPKILFERHIFHRETHGAFDASAPDISNPTAGGYGDPGAHQYDRLSKAIVLNRTAALHSASWGLGQVMGFNAQKVGFSDVEAMVAAMLLSEDSHLLAMAKFIKSGGLDAALRDQEWDTFAEKYNGSNYKENDYDGKLAEFFAKYSSGPAPDLLVRGAQIFLTYLGENPGPIDGVLGSKTSAALLRLGAPGAGKVDASTVEFLRRKIV